MDQVIELIEETLRSDLEQCESAIRDGAQTAALEALQRAFSKLDTALDLVRSQPRMD